MRGSLTVGRILGTPIRLSYNWFVIFIAIAAAMAFIYFPEHNPGMHPLVSGLLSIAVSFMLLASVLFHEIGHSLAARHYGVEIEEIELFIMGGLSRMKEEPLTATSEFWVSFTGPLFSLLLALLFRTGMLLSLRYPDAAILYSSFTYLFLVNLLLGILNLLPGFPMDGGRVLKGVLWGLTGNRNRAARVSVSTGMGLAWLFMAAGLAIILMGLWLGAWLVLAGIFQAKAILPYAGSESRSWPGA